MPKIQNIRKLYLYKYMTLPNAIALFKNEKLWFSLPHKWKDPFEGLVTDCRYDINGNIIDFPLKNNLCATCFTKRFASEAQWLAYSHNSKDVMVQLVFDNDLLMESIEKLTGNEIVGNQVYTGDVVYFPYQDAYSKISALQQRADFKNALLSINSSNVKYPIILSLLKPLLIKYNAFEYEEERRFFVITQKEILGNGLSLHIPNIAKAVKEVRIDPNATKDAQENAKRELRIAIGCPDKTVESDVDVNDMDNNDIIRDNPDYDIRISIPRINNQVKMRRTVKYN